MLENKISAIVNLSKLKSNELEDTTGDICGMLIVLLIVIVKLDKVKAY